jgi:hypothetical protein
VPRSGDHLSKEAKCHILEQGMKKERLLIAGTKTIFFKMFNQAKRELGKKFKLTGNKRIKLR